MVGDEARQGDLGQIKYYLQSSFPSNIYCLEFKHPASTAELQTHCL